MKKFLFVVVVGCIFSGCAIFKKQEKYDCPTNGKNIGAEKILSGDKDAIKAAKKAPKFGGPESY
jgi:hypothetical protein